MSVLAINAVTRKDLGKGAVRRLRNKGQAPGVVYGGKSNPISIEFRHSDLLHSLENETFYSSILNLKLDGKAEKVVLRDVQRHPAKLQIMHIDFQRVSASSEITMSVPVHYLNAEIAAGIKTGGVIDIMFNELSVRCLAKNLPESLEVDLLEMEIGDSVSFTDVKLPKGVSLSVFSGMNKEDIQAHDQVVVSIHEPKAVVEPEEIVAEATDETTVAKDSEAKSDGNTE